jgi:hypothetical protein
LGFVEDYVQYASEATDAPLVYHRFVAYTVLATVVGGRVVVPFGHHLISPNIYAILLGPSSTYRKSTAIKIGQDLVRYATSNGDLCIDYDASYEGFHRQICDKKFGMLAITEFAEVLTLFERDYARQMKAFLTRLFDCQEPISRRLKSGISSSEGVVPVVSILAASTMEWLLDKINEADIRGGFFARFLFVNAKEKEKDMTSPPPRDEVKREQLIKRLWGLREKYQPVDITSNIKIGGIALPAAQTEPSKLMMDLAAHKAYREWAGKFEKHARDQKLGGHYIEPMVIRLQVYFLKFALLEAVSKEQDKIDLDCIAVAKQVIEYLQEIISELVQYEFAFSEFGRRRNRVYRYIEEAGEDGLIRSKLIRKLHLNKRQLSDVIDVLLEGNLIRQVTLPGKTKKRTFYIATKFVPPEEMEDEDESIVEPDPEKKKEEGESSRDSSQTGTPGELSIQKKENV